MRGRTIRKQRERLTAERRNQSVTKVEILPNKDSSSVVEETPSSEQMESRTAVKVGPHQQQKQKQQQHYHKTTISSPYSYHKRRRVKEQTLNEDDLRKGKNDFHIKKDPLCDGEDSSAQNEKPYQLYTLYRDKDGNIRQAPGNGCHCKPLLKKLEGQLKATNKEMRLHILNIHEQVNSRLSKMDRRNRHRQVSHELKRWCIMSQLKDMDVHNPVKAQYYKLLPSPSVEQSVADADLESLPLLSVVSGDSSTSLATYVNILPSKSTYSLGGPEEEQMGSGTYFEKKVDRSPDDFENTALFPLPADHTSGLLLGSVDPRWQPPGVQDNPIAAVEPLCGECFSSSSQPSISDHGPRLIQHQKQSYDRQCRKHFAELMSSYMRAEVHAEGTRTLEFDRPTEPTLSQEKNNLHAMEVTQRFFEAVSTQFECWYERKIVEVEQQTELRAQQDRKELLQRISTLERELQMLKTNENAKR
ncbi:ankyrin repeat domain-containing protein 6-like isoform X2 [Siniperca chuatsi]|uniref:ankyrin repeat domain-containing protein 6-like isoform X2 n=1 Tax=Siniperca chuatsi TaxID=119488 RepID=UPI001CE0E9DB|nr:ankyrin repeat domain-containing protein 6-like isoform X2 [Siniperca chuatsi]